MKNKQLWIIAGIAFVLTGVLVFKTATTLSSTTDQFADNGYILDVIAESDSEEAAVLKHSFSGGTNYKENYNGSTVSFKDNNGSKVSTEKTNFVHYETGSMSALSAGMILDTDDLDSNQIYSLPAATEVQKTGTGYSLNNAGEIISLTNFIWKLSPDLYMAVSDEIELHVSETSSLEFDSYVEIQYEEGIVYLINESGKYPTISSDAYLELKNGARLYLGSKNVAMEDDYKMNLSTILVNPEDGAEIIPDDDFTIEVDKTPHIIVNVSDGKDGTGGEDGDGGDEGTQGNGGKGGSQGSKGPVGTSADNSNISYIPDSAPIFEATLTPKSYGVNSTLKMNSNGSTVSAARVIIYEKETGTEVYSKAITDLLNETSAFNGPQIDTLKQNTAYNYIISATYKTGANTDEVTATVLNKVFYTSTLGVELKHKYSTVDSVVASVVKTTADGADKIRVKCFDDNMVFTGYCVPANATQLNYVDSGANQGSFDIPSTLAADGEIEISYEGLEADKAYYFQIEALHMSGETQIIPSDAFPYEKYATLKRAPLVSKPSVKLNEETNSFVVNTVVNDYDNGITGYRYEVYTTDGYINGSDPVTSLNKPSLSAVSILLDGVKVKREVYYVIQVVALFNDNYNETEYRSVISDVCFAGASSWPSIEMPSQQILTTGSTAEGKILVSDPNGTIVDCGSEWTMKIAITPTAAIGAGDINRQTQEVYVDQQVIEEGIDDGYYAINYAFKALKSNTNYTITVYAHHMVLNNLDLGGDDGIVVGTKSITTPSYEPLYVRSVAGTDVGDWFNLNVIFSPKSDAIEILNESEVSKVDKLINLADVSGRSMTAVVFEIYKQDDNGKHPSNTCIDSYMITDINEHSYSAKEYAFNYGFDSLLYKKAYSRSNQGGLDDYCINLSDASFPNLTSAYLSSYSYDYVYIKVRTIYDYTYGTGGADFPIYGALSNTIPVGETTDYMGEDDITDCWIAVELNVKEPTMPAKPYFYDTALTKYIAEGKKDGVVAYYSITSNYNNVTSGSSTTLADMIADPTWTEIKSGTDVGLQITGPGSLAKNSNAVRYTIYKWDDATDKYILATQSAWLSNPNDSKLATYTYFLNVQNTDTGVTCVRGDKIKVKMELELSKVKAPGTVNPMIWPTQSTTLPAGTEIASEFILSKEMPSIRFIPVDGDANSSGTSDKYAFLCNDPDKAFTYDNNNKLCIYSEDGTQLTTSYTDWDRVEGMKLLTISPSLPSGTTSIMKYRLQTYSSSVKYSTMIAISEATIRGNKQVTYKTDDPDYQMEVDASGAQNIVIKFYINASAPEDLIRVDAIFSKGTETAIGTSLGTILTPIEKTVGDETITFYEVQAIAPLTTAIKFAGQSGVSCKVKCHFDSGKYGINYLNDAHLNEMVIKTDENKPYIPKTAGGRDYIRDAYTLQDSDIILANSDNKKAYTITFDNLTTLYSFDSTGIDVVPKQASSVESDPYTGITLGNIDPNVYVGVTTGYSVAKTRITVTKDNTLNVDKGLEFYYRVPQTGDEGWKKIDLSLENGTYQWDKMISGLLSDTTYEYKVIGYQLENDILKSKTFKTGNFKTKSEIPFTVTEFTFIAEADGRDSKYATAAVRSTNLLYTDLIDSISSIRFRLLDEDNVLIATSSITPEQYAASMPDECKVLNSAVAGDTTYNIRMNWAPSADGKHIMDGAHTYHMQVSFIYEDEAQAKTVTLSNTPEPWAYYYPETGWNLNNEVTFAIIPSTGVEKIAAGDYNFYLDFTVTGTDFKRMIGEVYAGQTRYLSELHKVTMGVDTVVVYQDTMLGTNDIINYEGSIAQNTIRFNYMEPDSYYYLKVYVSIDNMNTGVIGLAAGDDLTLAYSASSSTIKTPSSIKIDATSLTLLPYTGQIKVDGENLDHVKKIRYELTNKTTQEQIIKTLKVGGEGDANITTNFFIDSSSGSSNKYILNAPKLNNAQNSYAVKIYFYNDVDASTAQDTIEGLFTYKQPDNTSMSFQERFNSMLKSIFNND